MNTGRGRCCVYERGVVMVRQPGPFSARYPRAWPRRVGVLVVFCETGVLWRVGRYSPWQVLPVVLCRLWHLPGRFLCFCWRFFVFSFRACGVWHLYRGLYAVCTWE